jgi:hypothetical protein
MLSNLSKGSKVVCRDGEVREVLFVGIDDRFGVYKYVVLPTKTKKHILSLCYLLNSIYLHHKNGNLNVPNIFWHYFNFRRF